MARRGGRKTDYTEAKAIEICARLADGNSLRSVCLADDMPSKTSVFRWLAEQETFRDMYQKAMEARADAHAEEILDIADDGTNDWMEIHDKNGECTGYKLNGEAVQRSRLRVDARKWIMAKMRPIKYGDSMALTGKDGGPIETSGVIVVGGQLNPQQWLEQHGSGQDEVTDGSDSGED